MKEMTAVDLFCGAGGLSEGFQQAGFMILAGNDFDEYAGATFGLAHDTAEFLPGPIEEISAGHFLRATGLKKGELDCLIGGPPCQAFSVYNHQRGLHDKRSRLFEEYLRVVRGLAPKWVVLENVTGITSAGKGRAVRDILAGLSELGYVVDMRILRAEEYGVPQERRRVFFVGNRVDLPVLWPQPTHGRGLLPFVTVGEAISDLPILKNGEDPGPTAYRTAASSGFQAIMRGEPSATGAGLKVVHNHAAPRLAPINLQRMKHVGPGGSWRDIPRELLPAGMKKARRCDHTKRYGRLRNDGLSCTILTKCDIHWGAYIHPEQDRVLTVREAARLQSFPDRFRFRGPRTEQFVQVGNAVPPVLGKRVAQAMLHAMQFADAARQSDSALELAIAV